jgi:hypothetical protein
VIPETYSETGVELLGELPLAHSPEIVGEYEFALVNGLGEPAFASVRDARQNRDNNSARPTAGGSGWSGIAGCTWGSGIGELRHFERRRDVGRGRRPARGLGHGGAAQRVDDRADRESRRGLGRRHRLPEPALSRARAADTARWQLQPPGLVRGGRLAVASEFAEFLGPLEYVLRYDVLDDDQLQQQEVLDGQRFAAGIVFHPREHFRLKAEYEIVDDESSELENNGFLFQGAVDW